MHASAIGVVDGSSNGTGLPRKWVLLLPSHSPIKSPEWLRILPPAPDRRWSDAQVARDLRIAQEDLLLSRASAGCDG